jgi:TMAO reductase system sensor TorS
MNVGKKLLFYFIVITLFSVMATGIAWFSSSTLKFNLERMTSETFPKLLGAYSLSESIGRLTDQSLSLSQVQDEVNFLQIEMKIQRERELVEAQLDDFSRKIGSRDKMSELSDNLGLVFAGIDDEKREIRNLIKLTSLLEEKIKKAHNFASILLDELKEVRLNASDRLLDQTIKIEDLVEEGENWRKVSQAINLLTNQFMSGTENANEMLIHSNGLLDIIDQINEVNSTKSLRTLKQQFDLDFRRVTAQTVSLEEDERARVAASLKALRLHTSGDQSIFTLKVQITEIRESLFWSRAEKEKLRATITRQVGEIVRVNQADIVRESKDAESVSAWGIGVNIVIGAISILLALVIIRYFVYGNIILRLNVLSAHTKKLAAGDLNIEISRAGEDELAEMASSLQVFKENAVALQEHRTGLENLVDERTKSLTAEVEERKLAELALRVARDEAEEATRAKSDFLANMSHEIRTPMNAVIGLSNLALDTDLTAQQRDYLSKIEGSGKALLGVINDILDFSKIEAGMLEVEKVPFDLHSEVLENLSSVIGLKAAEKGLELIYDFDSGLPTALVGDPLRLGQVLINLCNNAVKFTDRGDITLGISAPDLGDESVTLRMEIRDTGIGMTQAQLGRLFQAFSQADTSTTREFGGTGLGLTISKRLVELMGGEIGVESEPSKGSTFWFTVRLGRAEEDQVRQKRELDAELHGLKVLVVDDNPTSRVILSRYLYAFDYVVEEAGSGAEAIGQLEAAPQKEPFDLVLMDWKMPDMDGLEATRRIKADEKLAKVPAVMMVTAYDREQLEAEAADTSLDGILVKPVSQSTLLDGIHTAFGKDAAVRDRRRAMQLPDHCQGARLLLVEDNVINQQVAREILEKAGCEVTLAVDGSLGVAAVRERPDYYDGVLMDIQMPVLDGYGAAREIRTEERFEKLPIIAMTANAFSSDREKALEHGMVDHVAKPIEVKNLFEVMGRWITVPVERRRATFEDQQVEAAAADTRETAMPDIPGVDIPVGLDRLGGNRALYLDLLGDFAEQQAGAAEAVRQALAADDIELATREAHTVKGVAANLAIPGLLDVAGVLEVAIPGGNAEETKISLAKFSRALEDSVRAITSALGGSVPAETAQNETPSNCEEELTMEQLILVAEDNAINRKIIARQLSVLGYECETANDGKEALEMLGNQRYGLLLTDLDMPEVDGFELTTRIRDGESGGNGHLPVIAITGTVDDEVTERCRATGMDECVSKPIDMDELKQLLVKYL